MEYDEYRSVPIELIDEADPTFRISFARTVRGLEASMARIGMIHPPILLARQQHYVIISGFARIAAARRLNWPRITARCLPAGTPFQQTALLAISENAGQRELNIVELARCLSLIARHTPAAEEQVRLLQELGFAVNLESVGRLARVLQLSERLQQGVVQGTVALPVALRLLEMQDAGAAEALQTLFEQLRLGLNRQREMLDWMQEISLRDGLPIPRILDQDPLAGWRADSSLDRGHLSQLIRRHLKSLRYPELSAYEARFARKLKELKLAPQIRLEAPPFFEGRTFHLRLEFQDSRELQGIGAEIQRIAGAPALAEILSLAAAKG